MCDHHCITNQGGVGSVGGEGEAVARKVRDKEKTVSPPCLFHPPDAGEDVVVFRILLYFFHLLASHPPNINKDIVHL